MNAQSLAPKIKIKGPATFLSFNEDWGRVIIKMGRNWKRCMLLSKKGNLPSVVAHNFNYSTLEEDADRSLSLKLAYSTKFQASKKDF